MSLPGSPGTRPAVRFLRTFAIALVGILVLAWVGSRMLSMVGSSPDYGAQRPTPATLRGYRLSFSTEGSPTSLLTVDGEGKACDALADSRYLRDSCVLAVNVDPAWIAAPAAGRLNNEDTPSYVAITWRAVMAGNPALCNQGGLVDARLEMCREAAAAGTVTNTDGAVSVTIVRQ